MKQVHFSRKTRQLKRLVQALNSALKKTPELKERIEKLKLKIASMVKSLRGVFPKYQLGKVLGSLAVFFGLSFSNQAAAQYFLPQVTNPFGLAPTPTIFGEPEMVDLDDDGDLDILAGGYYGAFAYYENTGTASAPAFAALNQNPFGLTGLLYFSSPTAADIDNDGDFDIIAGEYYGNLHYFQNTGTASAPAFAAPVMNPFGLSAESYFAFPEFVDLDNDGDFDLLVGQYYGVMEYFQNTGTPAAPAFAAPVQNPFGMTNGYLLAVPDFADLDGDGDLDLLVGEYYGAFQYAANTGTVSSPAFAAPQLNPFGLSSLYQFSFPAFADIDNDGDFDLLAAEYYGIFQYFENINCTPGISIDVQTACNSFDWIDGNTYYDDNNTAAFVIPNGSVNGCDSIIKLDLTMNYLDVDVLVTDPSMGAAQPGAVYQWLDCDNAYAVIPGATAQTYVAASNGNYAVEIEDNGCLDTSLCVTISTVGLEDAEFFTGVAVYPNPTDGSVNINLGNLQTSTVRLLTVDGKVIFRKDNITSSVYQFDLNEAAGIYFVEIISEGEKKEFRLVKN